MDEPTWRTHPLHTVYEVSDDGQVRSKDRMIRNRWGSETFRPGRVLAIFLRHDGYLGGNISIDGVRTNFQVHVFVCEAFRGLRPMPNLEVRHLNGDELDNQVENLAWGTKSENQMDAIRLGRNRELNKTHCPAGHLYDEANTYRAAGAPNKRKCRACINQRSLARSRR